MSEYKDKKNNVFPIIQTSCISESEKEEIHAKIIEELYAIFKR